MTPFYEVSIMSWDGAPRFEADGGVTRCGRPGSRANRETARLIRGRVAAAAFFILCETTREERIMDREAVV